MEKGNLIHAIIKIDDDGNDGKNVNHLNEREIEFLKFACSELNNKEITDKMFVNPHIINGYRDSLFKKLHVKTGVGLICFPFKMALYNYKNYCPFVFYLNKKTVSLYCF